MQLAQVESCSLWHQLITPPSHIALLHGSVIIHRTQDSRHQHHVHLNGNSTFSSRERRHSKTTKFYPTYLLLFIDPYPALSDIKQTTILHSPPEYGEGQGNPDYHELFWQLPWYPMNKKAGQERKSCIPYIQYPSPTRKFWLQSYCTPTLENLLLTQHKPLWKLADVFAHSH